jgi:hypothetical protein
MDIVYALTFLKMVSDMSGCSGNQAVAVSMRELSLGLVRPNELLRVMRKEAALGILNGLALGILLGGGGFSVERKSFPRLSRRWCPCGKHDCCGHTRRPSPSSTQKA